LPSIDEAEAAVEAGDAAGPIRPLGLRARLMIISVLVLGVGLGLTAWVLDRSFSASVVAGAQDQLKLLIYGLLGAAEEGDATLTFPSAPLAFPNAPLEPRLLQPDSGLYAVVTDAAGATVWRSPSLQLGESTTVTRPPPDLVPGDFRFGADAGRFEVFYRVIWEAERDRIFTFHVFADQRPYRAAIAGFRRTLTLGLAGVVAALMAAQAVAIAWGLRPVAAMARHVDAVAAGSRERMGEHYPPELSGLARNIDRFIDHEMASRDRYRRAMDDLAHSLKTPLAVLRNALAAPPFADAPLLREQVLRMERAIAHQLSRALAARPIALAGHTLLAPVLQRLAKALGTAYADKNVELSADVTAGLRVRCDERDLMEMLGNLLDNAFKYCTQRVEIAAAQRAGSVRVVIDDDGPGVPVEQRTEILARGARGDTAQPGHGIGLAVVAELSASYRGSLTIDAAPLGGARVVLDLPAAG
jgi:two-component system, OmpR family, sensor histidine kinase PhoQ